MKGKMYLKVMGILFIIGAALGIVLLLIAGGLSALFFNLEYYTGTEVAVSVVSIIFGLIAVVVRLIAGILGVKNCEKPEKANVCLGWGIALIALEVLSFIYTIITDPSGIFNIFNIFLGLVFPVLYIVGAVLNKKSAQ